MTKILNIKQIESIKNNYQNIPRPISKKGQKNRYRDSEEAKEITKGIIRNAYSILISLEWEVFSYTVQIL